MSKEKKHSGTKDQMDKHVNDILSVLSSIDSHLASLVYEATPSRGFAAGIERAIAQPFTGEMSENKKNDLKRVIREEIKKALGDK
jgi:hypothetical protein|tara:strand:- start:711 stop:965 length:255 start_codon:yes stop_codon:yes gene_type:complete